ncbi:hypothetical protein ACAN107058_21085 [Paracidovorax anthurii]
MAHLQGEHGLQHGQHGHGVMRLLLLRGHPRLQAARQRAAQRRVHRVVLEHQQRVEEPRATFRAGPALHVVQRRVLMLAGAKRLVLQGSQPVPDLCSRLGRAGHRQGVDEQAHHAFDAGQLGRAPRHGGAEDHRLLPRVALQQQRPGRLYQRVERHALALGERLEPLRPRCVEGPQRTAGLHRVLAAGPAGRQGIDQARRLLKAAQRIAPIGFVGRGVTRLQPLDVVAVAPRGRGLRRPAIMPQHLGQQLRRTPAIQQHMVQGPDEVVAPLPGAHQHEARERRRGEIEAARQLLARTGIQAGTQVAGTARIHVPPGQRQRALHPLQGPLAGREHPAAQHFVALEHRRPGCTQALGIQILEIHPQLVGVGRRTGVKQALENQACLQRRERIEVFHPRQVQP